MKKYFSKSFTKKQLSDAGMALVLILLLIGLFTKATLYYKLAVPALFINMIFPLFFYPFAFIWYGFTNLLGTFISKLLLMIIYIILVLPFGMIRRLFGKDSLHLNDFKKDTVSVMQTRNHRFLSEDIVNPY
jgi:hypothetical protein